jgi:hypothetical protein
LRGGEDGGIERQAEAAGRRIAYTIDTGASNTSSALVFTAAAEG